MSTPAAATAAFVDDYTHLRWWGYTDQQVADRLGVKIDSLLRRVKRNGCQFPDPTNDAINEILDRLINSGQPFHSGQLPDYGDQRLPGEVVQRAVKSGRVRKIGTKPCEGHGRPLPVFIGVVVTEREVA